MKLADTSIAMKIGYMHAALSDDDVLAECGIWHVHEDDPCPIAENWVIVRTMDGVARVVLNGE